MFTSPVSDIVKDIDEKLQQSLAEMRLKEINENSSHEHIHGAPFSPENQRRAEGRLIAMSLFENDFYELKYKQILETVNRLDGKQCFELGMRHKVRVYYPFCEDVIGNLRKHLEKVNPRFFDKCPFCKMDFSEANENHRCMYIVKHIKEAHWDEYRRAKKCRQTPEPASSPRRPSRKVLQWHSMIIERRRIGKHQPGRINCTYCQTFFTRISKRPSTRCFRCRFKLSIRR